MKKFLFLFLISIFVFADLPNLSFAETDTSNWYVYNGQSQTHSFSYQYPENYQAKTDGDDFQGLTLGTSEDFIFSVREFEGQTYDQVINYYTAESFTFLKSEDVFLALAEETPAKIVYFTNIENNDEFNVTLIKHGALILGVSTPDSENETLQAVYDSLRFTDNWHQYIDYREKYTFSFPNILKSENLSAGVRLYAPQKDNQTVFEVMKYEDVLLEDAPLEAKNPTETLQGVTEFVFHGIGSTIKATYYDAESTEDLSRILIEHNSTSYSLTDLNIATDFPHADYYDEYLTEVLESFEFFDIDTGEYNYQFFPDVKDTHQNELAINYLKENSYITGYPDGTFQPDAEINRAELTTMVVAVVEKSELDVKYQNCFSDVHAEWFAKYICYAKEKNWVAGYDDGTFKPDDKINRVEALKIILNVLFDEILAPEVVNYITLYADVDITQWYGKYFIFAEQNELLDLNHVELKNAKYYFYPDNKISRKEVAETIYRSLMLEQETL